MLDLLIRSVQLASEGGDASKPVHIGIQGQRIAYIGPEMVNAAETLDASGLVASAGWIDSHTHTDVFAEMVPDATGKILQGVTTDIAGLCSISAAPILEQNLCLIQQLRSSTYPKTKKSPLRAISFEVYRDIIQSQKNATNMAMFVGNANLRTAACGLAPGAANSTQLDQMQGWLREAMQQGALGLSSGLNYVPSMFSDEAELVALCKELPAYDGIYNSHMRNEGDRVIDSVREVIAIAEKSGCRGHISHLKCVGKANHGKSEIILELIDQANARGVPISFDVYPYTAGSISRSALLPEWVLAKSGVAGFEAVYRDHTEKLIADFSATHWDNILLNVGANKIVISAANGLDYEGRSLQSIAEAEDISVIAAIFQILDATSGGATIVFHSMAESDVVNFLQSRYGMIGSDAYARKYTGFTAKGVPHPRNYGTFPRFIERYVKTNPVLSLEQALAKLTHQPADWFGLADRGRLEVGAFADIVLFDFNQLRECGSFDNPLRAPEGIQHIFVNGGWAVQSGKANSEVYGHFIGK